MIFQPWLVALVDWLTFHGGQINYQRVWHAQETENRGVGLFASKDLEPNTTIFVIPSDCIHYGDRFDLTEWAYAASIRLQTCNEDDSAFCIDSDDSDEEGGANFWASYVASLPTSEERYPTKSIFYKAYITKDYQIDPLVISAVEFCPDWIPVADWLLYFAIISARMHLVWVHDRWGDLMRKTALVPLADLLNTNVNPNVLCSTRVADDAFLCTTTSHVARDTELFVQYGNGEAESEALSKTYGVDFV